MKRKIVLSGEYVGSHVYPRPEVTLWVRSRYLDYVRVRFAVDTGADVTSLPIALAQREGIAFDRAASTRGTVSGLVGTVTKYHGSIHVRLFGEEFDWPCDFLEAPPSTPGPAPPARAAARPYGVLGRTGFLEQFAFCVREHFLIIERLPTRVPWWRRLSGLLWSGFPRLHPVEDPL